MKHLLWALLIISACTSNKKNTDLPIIFVGTYTQKLGHVDGKASGIYTCRMDTLTGALTVVDSVAIINPSFLTVSPNKKYLYSVGEVSGSGTERLGKVVAFKITEGGKLTALNEFPSYGNAPCHISTDKTGRFVFVANYVTGNIVSYGTKDDGSLTDSICMVQQEGNPTWAHNIQPSADNKMVWAVNKGADKIWAYDLTNKGVLTPKSSITTAAGAGPRHLDFNPKNPNRFVAINENSNALGSYAYDSDTKTITLLDSLSTLPSDFVGKNTCADVHFHPNGKFVYGSNRGHNSVAIYRYDEATGKLTWLRNEASQGEIPRNFMITPDGKFLLVAHQNSDNVVAFKIDAETGKLTPTGANSKVFTPVCLRLY